MKTISQAAAEFGLSRSTLLYYDRIGLCRPSYRTAAGYRLYAEEELRTLELVRQYRDSGMGLREISDLLEDHEPDRVADALNRQLDQLNKDISSLRHQQAVVIELLRDKAASRPAQILDKRAWILLLKNCGMSDADMIRWHALFERQSPEAHQDFLESLSIPEDEIKRIRKHARESSTKD